MKSRSHVDDLYEPIQLLCGSTAYFDTSSMCSHRCDTCNATVGSVGMPRRCKELYDMEEVINKLKGNNGNKLSSN